MKLSLIVILSFLTILIPASSQSSSLCPSCKVDFAIYDPGLRGDGVWPVEVAALKSMFDGFGWTYEILSYSEIINGGLGQGLSRRFHGLIMPGGYVAPRIKSLGIVGKNQIEAFVKGGGNYVSFCAGSYYASQYLSWAEVSSGGPDGTFNAGKDYLNVFHQTALSLFPGTIKGPLGWAPWKNGRVADGLETAEINSNNSIMNAIGAPHLTKLFYYGGPFFKFQKRPANLEIWARAIVPPGTPAAAASGNLMPTIVRYHYGFGNVVLFSYHPIIILGGMINGINVQVPLKQPVLKNDPSPLTLDQVNFQSWNILHAALQLTSDQNVTPLTLSDIQSRFKR